MATSVPSQASGRHTEDSVVSTRPWLPKDSAWYVGHLDAEIARWTLENVDVDETSWRESVSRSLATGSIWHAIECCGKPVGSVKAVPLSDHIAISYWVAADERGNGYATSALAAMTRRAVDSGWGRPIELEIHPDNKASIATATAAGYSFYELRDSCNACSDETGRSAIYRWLA